MASLRNHPYPNFATADQKDAAPVNTYESFQGNGAVVRRDRRGTAHGGGLTPLEYLSSIMRDESRDDHARFDAAKAVAPYVHPRLTAVEMSGPDKGPIEHKDVSDEVRLEAFMAFLARKGLKVQFEAARALARDAKRLQILPDSMAVQKMSAPFSLY